MIEAIILAGGMGTRLQKVVSDVPKPMAPVRGIPFLFYLLKWLSDYPVDRIILSAGYKHESIRNYFSYSFGSIPLEYVIEEKPLGTGGAVIKAIGNTASDNVLILNGDTWFPVNLVDLHSKHVKYSHIFSIALKHMENFSRYGSVECEGNIITGFNEKKQCDEGLINGGIYLVKRSFFESQQYPEVFSLENDLLAKAAATRVLRGIIFDEPFLDIGDPDDYLKAGTVLKLE